MIADLKPYAEYQASGLPWIREMPTHWTTERAKLLFVKMSRPVRPEDEVVTCFRDGTVTLRRNRRLRGYTEATVEHGYQGIRKGDLVIHGMDAFAGAIGVSDSDGKGTPVYNVCMPREGVNAMYYAHLVRYMSQSNWILALAKGIRERSTDFRFETFANQQLPLPPYEEQAAIARFLNWANGRLERSIRAKRKVVALLNEQKQAAIQTSINQAGQLATSMLPVRAVLRPIRRPGFPDQPLLSLFRDFGVVLKDSRENKNVDVHDLALCQRVEPGDVVVNKMKAWQGSIAVSDLGGIVSPDYMVLRFTSERFHSKYFHFLLRSPELIAEYRRQAYGVRPGQWRLMYPDLCRINLPVPSWSEQAAIAESISGTIAKIDTAQISVRREVELLLEYRDSLFAAIVSGQLDVRAATASLTEANPADFPDDISSMDDDAELADDKVPA